MVETERIDRDGNMKLRKHKPALAAAIIAAIGIGGCAVGPDFREPKAPATDHYTETPLPAETVAAPEASHLGQPGAAQHFVSGQDIPAEWWAVFHSEPLDQLIRTALADSPNLAAAQAALRQARETLAAERGMLYYPQV